jgi:hypothetical protein
MQTVAAAGDGRRGGLGKRGRHRPGTPSVATDELDPSA